MTSGGSNIDTVTVKIAQAKAEKSADPVLVWIRERINLGILLSNDEWDALLGALRINSGRAPSRDENNHTPRNKLGADMFERRDLLMLQYINDGLSKKEADMKARDDVISEFRNVPHAPKTTSAIHKILGRSDEGVNELLRHRKRTRKRKPLNY